MPACPIPSGKQAFPKAPTQIPKKHEQQQVDTYLFMEKLK